AGRPRDVLARRDEAIQAAEMMRRGLQAGAVVDLQLVAAPEIHAAVGVLGDAKLEVSLEVVELPIRREVGTSFRVLQDARHRAPLVVATPDRVPAVERLAV